MKKYVLFLILTGIVSTNTAFTMDESMSWDNVEKSMSWDEFRSGYRPVGSSESSEKDAKELLGKCIRADKVNRIINLVEELEEIEKIRNKIFKQIRLLKEALEQDYQKEKAKKKSGYSRGK